METSAQTPPIRGFREIRGPANSRLQTEACCPSGHPVECCDRMTTPSNLVTRTALILCGFLVIVGLSTLFASRSYVCRVWCIAKCAYPRESLRVLMVNTDATFHRRQLYKVHPDADGLHLRAIVLNAKDKVIATSDRDGNVDEHPPKAFDAPTTWLGLMQFRVLGWSEAACVFGWLLVVTGFAGLLLALGCAVVSRRRLKLLRNTHA
jgi:hypothetical protein